jgi:pyruvate formate lyase activating enzyme
MPSPHPDRRRFIKQCAMGACGLGLGAYAIGDLLDAEEDRRLRRGFAHDAPEKLWQWAREAEWYESGDHGVRCLLCPHQCALGEEDRGFCRTRVVKEGKLHTLVYGNPCSLHLDPIEKKPLYHFLPGSPILSLATAGCNLRCLNCQNWQISQSKPEELQHYDLLPEKLVETAAERQIPAIAYTYSEPIIYYEYARDAAALAREKGIRNVLVTAGYIQEAPLRSLCRVVDAANVDLKSFSNDFYKQIAGGTLKPVLDCLRIMREEGVWVEVTRLIVPTHSDDLDDIRRMCRWLVAELGADTPLHFSRFHPAYKLQTLPPTPAETMEQAYQIALEEGLHYAFVGNLAGHPAQDTICPNCRRRVIERGGMRVHSNLLEGGRCSCGERIAGVWM